MGLTIQGSFGADPTTSFRRARATIHAGRCPDRMVPLEYRGSSRIAGSEGAAPAPPVTVSGRSSPVLDRSRMPVLDAGSVDALLGKKQAWKSLRFMICW